MTEIPNVSETRVREAVADFDLEVLTSCELVSEIVIESDGDIEGEWDTVG